ncbi:MAG: FeoB-associated Cys-rich membrane protein [Lachnospiraceae bacterium]|nr:FeoB-associated Cys-rich membrane protein [Lachnospiraceae bacterium]
MENAIIGAILLVILGAAIIYIVKAKKSGAKCIGCPAGGNCSHKHSESGQAESSCDCGCGCGCEKDN